MRRQVFVLSMVVCCASAVFAIEPVGPFSVRGAAGAGIAINHPQNRSQGPVGPAVDGSLIFRAMNPLGLVFSYDRIDAGRDMQSETITGGVRLAYSRALAGAVPFLELAAGIGRGDSSVSLNRLAFKANVGLEHMVSDSVSVGAMAGYHYIKSGGLILNDVHELTPSAFAAYHF